MRDGLVARPEFRSAPGSATTAQRVNSPLVPASTSHPLNVPVFDLMHRPGEMREREIDATASEDFGNAVIGVKKGAAIHLDARLESLHDGILVTAIADAFVEGECTRCLDRIADTLRVDIALAHLARAVHEVEDRHIEGV